MLSTVTSSLTRPSVASLLRSFLLSSKKSPLSFSYAVEIATPVDPGGYQSPSSICLLVLMRNLILGTNSSLSHVARGMLPPPLAEGWNLTKPAWAWCTLGNCCLSRFELVTLVA